MCYHNKQSVSKLLGAFLLWRTRKKNKKKFDGWDWGVYEDSV